MSERPAPVRCGRCNGFVYGPPPGERAEIVAPVRCVADAGDNMVCACARCGKLYEVRTERAA